MSPESAKYTLEEARREMGRRECLQWGHDLEFIYRGAPSELLSAHCSRCYRTWVMTETSGAR